MTVGESEEDGEEIRFEGVVKERGVDLKTVTLRRVVFDCGVVGGSGRRQQWKERGRDQKKGEIEESALSRSTKIDSAYSSLL